MAFVQKLSKKFLFYKSKVNPTGTYEEGKCSGISSSASLQFIWAPVTAQRGNLRGSISSVDNKLMYLCLTANLFLLITKHEELF